PNQRLPLRQHSPDLHRGNAGTLQTIEQRGGVGAGNGEQIYVGAANPYFGGQSGGQGLQQSRAGDDPTARTGWFPVWMSGIADPNRIKKTTSRRVIFTLYLHAAVAARS